MIHDPSPREPYKSEPVSSHAQRFDPVTHSPTRKFAKSGYYLDPDFKTPRASKKHSPEVKPDPRNRRFHSLAPKLVGAKDVAKPGEVSSFYSGATQSSNHKAVDGVFYQPAEDNTWVPIEQKRELNKKKEEKIRSAQLEIDRASRQKAEGRRRHQEEKKRDLDLVHSVASNPYGRDRIGTRKELMQQGVTFNPPIEVLDKRGSRNMEGISGFSKPRGIDKAPLVTQVKQKFQTDKLGGVRYDNDALPEEKQQRIQKYQRELDAMVQERRAEAAARRQQSLMETDQDIFLSKFGKDMPDIDARVRGDIPKRANANLECSPPRKRDAKLAADLKNQIKEREIAAQQERHDTVELSDDPIAKLGTSQPPSNAHRVHHTRGNIIRDIGSEVEGHSLVNMINDPKKKITRDANMKRSKNLVEQEFEKSTQAIKAGESEFGKAGSGAPMWNKDGKIVPIKPSVSLGFETLELYDENTKSNEQKKKKILAEQSDFMKSAAERKKRIQEEQARAAAQAARTEFLKEGNNRRSKAKKVVIISKRGGEVQRLPSATKAELERQVHQERERKSRQKTERHRERPNQGFDSQLGNEHKPAKEARRVAALSNEPQVPIEEKQRRRDELISIMREKQDRRRTNRQRVKEAEMAHVKAANKFEGRPGGGGIRRNDKGEIVAKRGKGDGEHRHLLSPTSNLV